MYRELKIALHLPETELDERVKKIAFEWDQLNYIIIFFIVVSTGGLTNPHFTAPEKDTEDAPAEIKNEVHACELLCTIHFRGCSTLYRLQQDTVKSTTLVEKSPNCSPATKSSQAA